MREYDPRDLLSLSLTCKAAHGHINGVLDTAFSDDATMTLCGRPIAPQDVILAPRDDNTERTLIILWQNLRFTVKYTMGQRRVLLEREFTLEERQHIDPLYTYKTLCTTVYEDKARCYVGHPKYCESLIQYLKSRFPGLSGFNR